jgi:RNA polymerase sigma-B factor
MTASMTHLPAHTEDPSDQALVRLGDLMGEEDPQLEHALDIQSVWAHWGDLPERQQKLLMMRFYGNMSQAEIGDRLGISQMHVSRLLAAALDYLRDQIVGEGAGPRS